MLFSRPPFLLLLFAGLFLAGCPCHPGCGSVIRVEPATLTFSWEGEAKTADVITTFCWKVLSKPDWITSVTPNSGCDKTPIVVTADVNDGDEDLTGKIIFLAGNGDMVELIVKQYYDREPKVYSIDVAPKNVFFSAAAQVSSIPSGDDKDIVTVTCSLPTMSWALTSQETWLTLSLNSDGSGAGATVSDTGLKPFI